MTMIPDTSLNVRTVQAVREEVVSVFAPLYVMHLADCKSALFLNTLWGRGPKWAENE